MASIARLAVDLTLDVGNFRKGLGNAGKGVKKFTSGVASIAKDVIKMGAAMATVAAGAMAFFVKQQFKAVDATAKLARSINVTTEELTGLQFAAQIAGVGTEQLNKGLGKMVRTIGEAGQGIGEGKRALEELGISISDIENLSADEQFALIADKIGGLEKATDKAAVANQIFGRSGIQLIDLLNKQGDGIRSLVAENKRLGGSFDEIDAAKIEEANDAVTRAGVAFDSVFRTLSFDIAGFVKNTADLFTEGFVFFRQQLLPGIKIFVSDAIESIKSFVETSLPFVIDFVNTFIARIDFLSKAFLTGISFIADVFGKFLTMISGTDTTITSVSDSFRDFFILLQFGFKNSEKVIATVIDLMAARMATFINNVAFTFTDTLPAAIKFGFGIAIELAQKASTIMTDGFKLLGKSVVTLFKNLPAIIAGEFSIGDFIKAADFDKLSLDFKTAFKPPVRELSETEKMLNQVAENSLGQLNADFQDFFLLEDQKTKDTADKIRGLFDGLFDKVKLPELKVATKTLDTIKEFSNPKRVAAIQKGSIEAFRAGRDTESPDVKAQKETTKEIEKGNVIAQETNQSIKKMTDNTARVVVIGLNGPAGGGLGSPVSAAIG